VALFNNYGLWALPIVTLNGKVASMGSSWTEHISHALDEALQPKATTADTTGS